MECEAQRERECEHERESVVNPIRVCSSLSLWFPCRVLRADEEASTICDHSRRDMGNKGRHFQEIRAV